MVLEIGRFRIPAVELVLACDESVDLVTKRLAAHLDTGEPLPIIDEKHGKVDFVVSRGPVVAVIPDVEGEDGQTVPFVDGHQLGAARYRVDV